MLPVRGRNIVDFMYDDSYTDADSGASAVESDKLVGGIPATPMTAGIEAPLMKSYNLRLAGGIERETLDRS